MGPGAQAMTNREAALIVASRPAQYATLLALAQEHPGGTFHLGNCGCCVCFHPPGDKRGGWVIGSDGSSDYHPAHESDA